MKGMTTEPTKCECFDYCETWSYTPREMGWAFDPEGGGWLCRECNEAMTSEALHQCGELLLHGDEALARETFGEAFVDGMLARSATEGADDAGK